MKPDRLLETWETWACGLKSRPAVVSELTGGRTNRSYLLDTDGRRIVMRVNAPAERLPGIDRGRETRIWESASGAGLAPQLLHADPAERFIITEYIDGAVATESETDTLFTDRLFILLAVVHDLEVDLPVLDYSLYIGAYWDRIESGPVLHNMALRQQRQPMQALLAEFAASAPRIGLCHHDPVKNNVISTNDRLYLLDWEYASRGFVAMDYAVLGVEWGIADAEIVERTGVDPAALDMARQIYSYLCDLWHSIGV